MLRLYASKIVRFMVKSTVEILLRLYTFGPIQQIGKENAFRVFQGHMPLKYRPPHKVLPARGFYFDFSMHTTM